MKRSAVVSLLIVLLLFSTSFAAPRTLRIDYYHAGNSQDEWFSWIAWCSSRWSGREI